MDLCGYSGVKSFAGFCLKQNNFVLISKRIAESDKKIDIQTSEVDIETPKVDIGRICKNKIPGITENLFNMLLKCMTNIRRSDVLGAQTLPHS